MADITTECLDCGAELTIKQQDLDSALNCPSCGNILSIDPSLLPPPNARRNAVPPPLPGEHSVKVATGKRVRLKPNTSRGRKLTGIPRSSRISRGLPDVQENYGLGTSAEGESSKSIIGIVIGSINILIGVLGIGRLLLAVFLLLSMSSGNSFMGGSESVFIVVILMVAAGIYGVIILSGVGLIMQRRWAWFLTVVIAALSACIAVIGLVFLMAQLGGMGMLSVLRFAFQLGYPIMVLILLNLKRVRVAYAKV